MKLCSVAVLGMLLTGALATGAADIPQVNMPKVKHAPAIDGDLSDACWERAPVLSPFFFYNRDEQATVPTKGMLCYDDAALYVGFVCTEPDTDQLTAKAVTRDGPVNRDDEVELFIAPGTSSAYYHFMVNSINTQTDQRNWGRPLKMDYAWDGDWTSATKVVEGKQWTVEMAIPWHNFAADLGKGTWSFNLCRGKQTEPVEWTSFSFADGSFHNRERFAVVNPPDVDLSEFMDLRLYDVSIARYEVEEQGYAYTVEGVIANKALAEREVLIEVTDRPVDGRASKTRQRVQAAANKGTPFHVKVHLAGLGPRTLQVHLLDPQDGHPLLVNAFPKTLFPRLMTAFFDRSYYTTEEQARAVFLLNLPHGRGLSARAELRLSNGKTLSRTDRIVNPEKTALAFPLSDIPQGTNSAVLAVVDEKGRSVASAEVAVRKLPPAPEGVHEVKIDHERITVLLDGEPFFPICIYGVPREQMPTVAEAGFNTVIRWGGQGSNPRLWRVEGAEARRKLVYEELDAAHEAGLLVIDWPPHFMSKDGSYANPEFFRNWDHFVNEELPSVIEATAGHPALLAYYGPDEPGSSGPDDRKYWAPCKDYVDVVRAVDPYHPNYFLFCAAGSPEWPDVYDVSGRDYYGIGKGLPLISVYKAVRRDVETTHKFRVPNWHVPLMELCSASRYYLTGPMQRAQGYLSIIADTDGILWWIWPARYKDNWEAMKTLAREFNALSPVLTQGTPRHSVTYKERASEDTVKVLIKNRGDKTYLIACNAHPASLTATFFLPPRYKGEASAWFEDRRLDLEEGRFSDSFEGYGRRVYELAGSWGEGEELALSVAMDVPDRAEEVTVHEDRTVTNLIRDPGFETPDCWVFQGGDPKQKSVTGEFTQEQKHSGRQSAAIHRPHAEGNAVFQGWQVQLEPNTTYTFGGYASTLGGRASLFLQGPYPEGAYIRDQSTVHVQDRAGWGRYSTSFRTRDKTVRVSPMCVYGGEPGSAWFDDMFLRKSTASVNLLSNPGFETQGLPGWPEFWNPMYSLPMSGYIGGPDAVWGTDREEKYEGACSVRITKTSTSGRLPFPSADQYRLTLKPGDYVLSAYLKADKPDTKVRLSLSYRNADTQSVGTEWQRYEEPVTIEKTGSRYFVRVQLRSRGTLWVDGVQFEPGTKATDFGAAE